MDRSVCWGETQRIIEQDQQHLAHTRAVAENVALDGIHA